MGVKKQFVIRLISFALLCFLLITQAYCGPIMAEEVSEQNMEDESERQAESESQENTTGELQLGNVDTTYEAGTSIDSNIISQATVTIDGATVNGDITARKIVIKSGIVNGNLTATDSGSIVIEGGTITSGNITAQSGDIEITNASISLSGGISTNEYGNIRMSSGSLTVVASGLANVMQTRIGTISILGGSILLMGAADTDYSKAFLAPMITISEDALVKTDDDRFLVAKNYFKSAGIVDQTEVEPSEPESEQETESQTEDSQTESETETESQSQPAQPAVIIIPDSIEDKEEEEGDKTFRYAMINDAGKPDTMITKAIWEKYVNMDATLILKGVNYRWSIDCKQLTEEKLQNIDMGASFGGNKIPQTVLDSILYGNTSYTTLSLSHNGEYGFDATLEYEVDVSQMGKTAKLYYFDGNQLNFRASSKVSDEGLVSFHFSHASEYVIVYSETGISSSIKKNTQTSTASQTNNVATDKAKNIRRMLVCCLILFFLSLSAGIFCLVKYYQQKKKLLAVAETGTETETLKSTE